MLDVDAPTTAPGGAPCAGMGKLIDSANPAESLILNKLTSAPKCGTPMLSFAPLNATELACVTAYVNAGGTM